MNLLRRLRVVPFFMALFVLLFASYPTHAEGNTLHVRLEPGPESISTKSGYFVYPQLGRGTIIQDAVTVINTSQSDSIEILLFPSDADTANNGGIALPTEYGEETQNIGRWLTLEKERITLQAGEARLVPFTLTIPPDAPTGEHVAGILVQPSSNSTHTSLGDQIGLNVINRTGSTVMVTVAPEAGESEGELELKGELEILSLSADSSQGAVYPAVVAKLENQGNAGVTKAEGKLILRPTDGSQDAATEIVVRSGFILAYDTLQRKIVLSDPPPAEGQYEVTLQLSYGDGQMAELTDTLVLGKSRIEEREVIRDDGTTETVTVLTPDEEDQNNPIPTTWLIMGGAIVGLLLLIVLFQSFIMFRSRRSS